MQPYKNNVIRFPDRNSKPESTHQEEPLDKTLLVRGAMLESHIAQQQAMKDAARTLTEGAELRASLQGLLLQLKSRLGQEGE